LPDFSRRLLLTGVIYLAATMTLVVSRAPLGSTLFFACLAAAAGAYLAMLHAVWRTPQAPHRLLRTAFLFALAFRVPLAIAPVGADNDMVRYLWDGRVQRLGYNPYAVVPSDPGMAHTHTVVTRQMPSIRARTPYPPGAQLFFRLVVSIRETTRAMKLALVLCDVLTILVLWRWLTVIGQSPWLTLAYAWNPLVVLEVAHAGHIDALGALWIVTSAYFLARRRTTLASIALVLAIATKLLPIVLAPLFWRRIRVGDGVLAVALLGSMYWLFAQGTNVPVGAVPNVVAHIRFNGPVFRAIAAGTNPFLAAAAAVLLGLIAAGWARKRLDAADPAAWAWPMAAALAAAPVIYPWYLLYFTPFLWSRAAMPLLAWTLSCLPVYIVWDNARDGGRWIVPGVIEVFEFFVVAAAAGAVAVFYRLRQSSSPTAELS
jgi:alpha-1,6-mannosyltransferase